MSQEENKFLPDDEVKCSWLRSRQALTGGSEIGD